MSVTTPVPDGTQFAFVVINGVQYPLNIITDATGADLFGAVSAPASGTVLGLLTAILAAQTQATAYLAQLAGGTPPVTGGGSTDFNEAGNPIIGAVQ